MFEERQHRSFLRQAAKVVASLAMLFLCVQAGAQFLPRTGQATTPQPQIMKDALGRSTPRGTVIGFLNAARKGDDTIAAEYLNVNLSDEAARELAHQLFVVLERGSAQLRPLSNDAEGSGADVLHPNQDLVASVRSGGGELDIYLERVDRGSYGRIWLFSSTTLAQIPDAYEEIDPAPLKTFVPQVLMTTRFLGIALFEWLFVFIGIPLFFVAAAILNRMLSQVEGDVRRRVHKDPTLPNREILLKPIRLLLLALLIYWLSSRPSVPLLARVMWSGAAQVITVAACVWLLILGTGVGEHFLHKQFQRLNIAGTTSVLRLIRRLLDVLVVFAGIIVILRHFGVNTTAALAGLGVGGIAVALAAQKTLENVIGGVSLIMDRAVRVGEVLSVGDVQGTVEDIGLRSTRIRTNDRTVVNLPNGRVATMSLEDMSSRDKFWFHPTLNIRHGTTVAQMEEVLEGIRKILRESRWLEQSTTRVRFRRYAAESLDVEVYAYVLVREQNLFLEIQEELLLQIMSCLEVAGVEIAVPSQTVVVPGASSASSQDDLQAVARKSSGGN